jgi:hypothetical protein
VTAGVASVTVVVSAVVVVASGSVFEGAAIVLVSATLAAEVLDVGGGVVGVLTGGSSSLVVTAAAGVLDVSGGAVGVVLAVVPGVVVVVRAETLAHILVPESHRHASSLALHAFRRNALQSSAPSSPPAAVVVATFVVVRAETLAHILVPESHRHASSLALHAFRRNALQSNSSAPSSPPAAVVVATFVVMRAETLAHVLVPASHRHVSSLALHAVRRSTRQSSIASSVVVVDAGVGEEEEGAVVVGGASAATHSFVFVSHVHVPSADLQSNLRRRLHAFVAELKPSPTPSSPHLFVAELNTHSPFALHCAGVSVVQSTDGGLVDWRDKERGGGVMI